MKLTKSRDWWLLGLIMLAGFLIRVWQVGSLPAILNRDEAALAYNAVLLKEMGLDEWGRLWPLALESFGDFKLPGYVWSVLVSVSLFGDHDWAVRLPSVLAGTLLIGVSYFFGRRFGWPPAISLLFSVLVAVSPVFMFYSRMAFEANLGLLLVVIMISLLAFKPTRQPWTDVALVLTSLLAVFTYNTPFLLLPFLIILLPWVRGWRSRSWWGVAVGLVGVLILSGSVLLPLNQQKSGITIFSDPSVYVDYIAYRQSLPTGLSAVLGSKYAYWGQLMANNLLASVSPSFMVIRGGSHPWHQVPGLGHLYWSVYVMGWFGIVIGGSRWLTGLTRGRLTKLSPEACMLYLSVISLVPSIITVDSPHATRSLLFFWLWVWWATYGLYHLIEWVTRRVTSNSRVWVGSVIWSIFLLLLAMEAGHYVWHYFNRYPQHQGALRPGYEQMLDQYQAVYPGQPVNVIDPDGYHYILTAWYQQVPGSVFLSTIQRAPRDTIGFSYGQQVGNTRFFRDVTSAREAGVQQVIEWNNQTLDWQLRTLQ